MTQSSGTCQGAAAFQATDTSYAQMGPFENSYTTTTGDPQPQYAPVVAQEQQQPYVAAYTPEPPAQYVAQVSPPPASEVPSAPVPASVPTPGPSPAPLAGTKRKSSSLSPSIRSRGRSPMGHLPFREDIAGAGTKSMRSSIYGRRSTSASPSTPRPPSPVLQTLTFIPYPDLEPKGHGRGGDYDGHGDDEDDGSPRRGRRGKKLPKKEPFLACFFCRGRKIACHPKNDGGDDKTCT